MSEDTASNVGERLMAKMEDAEKRGLLSEVASVRESLMRPCMKCRKKFLPHYRYHTICGNCQKANKGVGGINAIPMGSIRRGVTPGGNN